MGIYGIMFTQAMSSAQGDMGEYALCLHISVFAYISLHRAKPVSAKAQAFALALRDLRIIHVKHANMLTLMRPYCGTGA